MNNRLPILFKEINIGFNDKKALLQNCLVFILVIAVIGTVFGQANKFDIDSYINSHPKDSLETVKKNFPYKEYLAQTPVKDIMQIQKDRYLLWKKFGDGDFLLFGIRDAYIDQNPIKKINDVKNLVTIAELYLDENKDFGINPDGIKYINFRTNEQYLNVGYSFTENSVRWLEEEVNSGRLKSDDTDFVDIRKRLENKKINLKIDLSPLDKLANRSIGQTTQRIEDELLTERTSNNEKKIGKGLVFLFILSLVSIIISCIFIYSGKSVLKSVGIIILICSVALFVWIIIYYSQNIEQPSQAANSNSIASVNTAKPENKTNSSNISPAPKKIKKSSFTLKQIFERLNNNKEQDKTVQINQIFDASSKEIGQAIIAKQTKVKSVYLTKPVDNIINALSAFFKEKDVFLITSGGYSNDHAQPEGFTIKNGTIVNAVLQKTGDGLVFNYCNKVYILNLKEKLVFSNVCDGAKAEISIDSPVNNTETYSKLLSWVKNNKVTNFQTHLLAYDNTLRIDKEKSNNKPAERRFLSLIRDSNNEIFYSIVNLKDTFPLAYASEQVFYLLQDNDYKVESIVNLDTGDYNVFEIYDNNKKKLLVNGNEIKGTKDKNEAVNLLVLYFD
jgi:Ca2+/Na+ antiporter